MLADYQTLPALHEEQTNTHPLESGFVYGAILGVTPEIGHHLSATTVTNAQGYFGLEMGLLGQRYASSNPEKWPNLKNSHSQQYFSAGRLASHGDGLLETLERIRATYLRRHEKTLEAFSSNENTPVSTLPYSDQQIWKIAKAGAPNISRWVELVAITRGIYRHHTLSENFAIAASRLSDAVVDLDQVEETLIALRQAGVLTNFQRGILQVGYLR